MKSVSSGGLCLGLAIELQVLEASALVDSEGKGITRDVDASVDGKWRSVVTAVLADGLDDGDDEDDEGLDDRRPGLRRLKLEHALFRRSTSLRRRCKSVEKRASFANM